MRIILGCQSICFSGILPDIVQQPRDFTAVTCPDRLMGLGAQRARRMAALMQLGVHMIAQGLNLHSPKQRRKILPGSRSVAVSERYPAQRTQGWIDINQADQCFHTLPQQGRLRDPHDQRDMDQFIMQ